MTAKFDWDAHETADSSNESKNSFNWNSYEDVKPERSKKEKTARVGAQYGLGQVDRALLPLTIAADIEGSQSMQTSKRRQEVSEELERLGDLKRQGLWDEADEKYLKSLTEELNNPEISQEKSPAVKMRTSDVIRRGVKDVTDYDLDPEGGLEKTAEVLGSFTPREIKSVATQGPKAVKNLFTKNKQTMRSGIEQPRAVDSKWKGLASIGKETKNRALKNLHTQTENLIKETAHKHQPVIKEIELGVAHTPIFNQRFAKLETAAAKSKASVDVTPMTETMEKWSVKYRGVPRPHGEAREIQREIKAFYNKPPTNILKALRTYRSNNRKLSSIYETSMLQGKRKELAEFLIDQNKSIAQSFRGSFGADNNWVKYFERTNNGYKVYMDGVKTQKALDPFFNGKLTYGTLNKFANNPQAQRKLALSMGEEGAAEIAQISKDSLIATKSIRDIPTSTLNKMDAVYPVTFLIPVVGKIAGISSTLYATKKTGSHLLGYYLSKPETRRAYKEALEAIRNVDIDKYKAATSVLLNSMKESD